MVAVTARSPVAVGQPPYEVWDVAGAEAFTAALVPSRRGFDGDAETNGDAETEEDTDADGDAETDDDVETDGDVGAVGDGCARYVVADGEDAPATGAASGRDNRAAPSTTPPVSTVASTAIRTGRRRPLDRPRRWRGEAVLLLTSFPM
ncbi:MSCRAMM family adhesin SdrC [Streptomyces sp. NBC_01390]|uniref:hypothetical protein n=1 Tax=Streptomyces sp. NBC_01390 TaxID=2903850 RepID=UPI003252C04B